MRRRPPRLLAALLLAVLAGWTPGVAQAPGFQIEVTLDDALPPQTAGRLLVVLAPAGGAEPRRWIGRTGRRAAPTLGLDVPAIAPGETVVVDGTAAVFPHARVTAISPGEYMAQAVLATNRDLRSPSAPGTLYSDPAPVTLGRGRGGVVRLTLTRKVPDETLPDDEGQLRFLRIRSDLLSAFHGRPIYLRAGVILPRGFDDEPARRYPVRVRIGGYGTRYTAVRGLMRPGAAFREAWLAEASPRMLLIHLDGAGPYGDPYQVNSANNGPYGDAITRELIPYVERRFRGLGRPGSRVLDGESTGGWVSLALQIFYPDYFGGAWASCPDSVDFRAFQQVDVYDDENAFVDARGEELASARESDGETRFTMRHEVQMENVLGMGDSWTLSGRQWGAWNAVYGPRGDDGLPVPLWDPLTGRIDRTVARQWARYDLRRVLEAGWDALAPRLRGKLNIWVGERDDYFLEDAVHLLDDWLAGRPGLDARIEYGAGRGHCWTGITEAEMLAEMGRRLEGRTAP